MSLPDLIRELREKKSFSQRQLSYISGVSNTEISRIEKGERKNPSADTLAKLAAALGVDYELLAEEAGYIRSDQEQNEQQNDFEKIGDLIINDEKIELYRKVKKDEAEREDAAAIETELTPEELQEIEDDKILASVEMMAAHMNPDAYGKPLSRETKNLIANAIREVRRKYGKKKTE